MGAGVLMVIFAFGVPWSLLSNQILREIAEKILKLYSSIVAVVCQKDAKPATTIPLYCIDKDSETAPPTLRIARYAVKTAKELGLTEILVVAAAPHLDRCIRDLRWAAEEINYKIKISHTTKIMDVPENSWFCKQSFQWWTTSWWKWWFREMVITCLTKNIYKKYAK